MATGRRAAARGLLALSLAPAAAFGQAGQGSTGSAVAPRERRPAPAAQQAMPAAAPAGSAERGRYLVMQVAMCVECHSPRDGNGEIVPGKEFTGGPIPFRPPWPNDWALQAPRNLGLPGYTTELGMRLLMQGAVDREGRQLRPPMPRFRMSAQDAADVVAYMKSLQ